MDNGMLFPAGAGRENLNNNAISKENSSMNKRNNYKVIIFSVILLLLFFLFVRPKTPQEQVIAKYIKEKGNSFTLTMIVRKSGRLDPKYGELYYVDGVIGDFSDVNFFYLIKDGDGWKVNSAGTGP